MNGPPVPMYTMPCICGITWYTTQPNPLGPQYCDSYDRATKTTTGCGRRLPAPTPEDRA